MAELRDISAFGRLTSKQRVCLTLYCAGTSAFDSILGAYDCKDLATVNRLQYDVFTRENILEVLVSYFGADSARVKPWINRARRGNKISAAHVHFWKTQIATA
jgi:hypothetical protein